MATSADYDLCSKQLIGKNSSTSTGNTEGCDCKKCEACRSSAAVNRYIDEAIEVLNAKRKELLQAVHSTADSRVQIVRHLQAATTAGHADASNAAQSGTVFAFESKPGAGGGSGAAAASATLERLYDASTLSLNLPRCSDSGRSGRGGNGLVALIDSALCPSSILPSIPAVAPTGASFRCLGGALRAAQAAGASAAAAPPPAPAPGSGSVWAHEVCPLLPVRYDPIMHQLVLRWEVRGAACVATPGAGAGAGAPLPEVSSGSHVAFRVLCATEGLGEGRGSDASGQSEAYRKYAEFRRDLAQVGVVHATNAMPSATPTRTAPAVLQFSYPYTLCLSGEEGREGGADSACELRKYRFCVQAVDPQGQGHRPLTMLVPQADVVWGIDLSPGVGDAVKPWKRIDLSLWDESKPFGHAGDSRDRSVPCGVLYYLGCIPQHDTFPDGTAVTTHSYMNPHGAGRVVAAMSTMGSSSSSGSEYYETGGSNFVQHPTSESDQGGGASSGLINCTDDLPHSWMSVDLGEGRRVIPTAYAVRHDGQVGQYLRHWELQGMEDDAESDGSAKSNAAKPTWVTLRKHDNDVTICSRFGEGGWSLTSSAACDPAVISRPYRHFRILQHGNNSLRNNNKLHCAGFEVYGTLVERE